MKMSGRVGITVLILGLAAASEMPGCADWFRTNPSRCKSSMYVGWCQVSAPSVCGDTRPNDRSSRREDRRRNGDDDPRPSPRPLNDPKDAIFKECASDQGVPGECLRFVTYSSPFSPSKILCDNPRCADFFPHVMYCGANDENHSKCCKDRGVPKECDDFCNGKRQMKLSKLFPNVAAALKLKPCESETVQRSISSCFSNNHSGKKDTKVKRWPDERMDPTLVQLATQQCPK